MQNQEKWYDEGIFMRGLKLVDGRIGLIITAGLLWLYPTKVLGQAGPDVSGQPSIQNPIQAGTIQELVNILLDIVVQVGTPVLVVMVVYTGFLFVTARGNEDQLTKAKSSFFWTIIGAAIVLGAFVISEAIQATIRQL